MYNRLDFWCNLCHVSVVFIKNVRNFSDMTCRKYNLVHSGCLEIYWNFKTILEILDIYWKCVNPSGKIFWWTDIVVIAYMADVAGEVFICIAEQNHNYYITTSMKVKFTIQTTNIHLPEITAENLLEICWAEFVDTLSLDLIAVSSLEPFAYRYFILFFSCLFLTNTHCLVWLRCWMK